MYAPEGDGGGGTPKGVNPRQKALEDQVATLADSQKTMMRTLNRFLGIQADEKQQEKRGGKRKGGGIIEEMQEGFAEMRDGFKEAFSLDKIFSGFFGEDAGLLGGMGGRGTKPAPKDRPTVNDLLALPVESSMGYLLLYWKLDELNNTLKEGGGGAGSKAKGIGGFFQGLLKGATGIAVLAGALILFAGAAFIFAQLSGSDWLKALGGLVMFTTFVIGSIALAKLVEGHIDDFLGLAKGTVILVAGLLLFSGAILAAAYAAPYVDNAIATLVAYGVFVAGAVLVANSVKQNMDAFVNFATGSVILAAGLAVFSGAVIIAAFASPYVIDAIPALAAYTLFVVAMAGVARIVGENAQNFIKFAIGSVLLAAGLVVFAGAIFIVNLISPDIAAALPTIALMTGLLLGFAIVGNIVGNNIQAYLLLLAGSVLLSVGLIAFAYAVGKLAEVRELLGPAIVTAGAMLVFLGVFGAIGALLVSPIGIFLIVGMGILATLSVLMAGAIIPFTRAVDALANVHPKIPDARAAIQELDGFLGETVQALGIGPIMALRLMAFSAAMQPFASAMTSMATMIDRVVQVGDAAVIREAIDSTRRIVLFLNNPNPTNEHPHEGVVQMIDEIKFLTLMKLANFGRAIQPFASAMNDLTEAIERVARVGNPESIGAAVEALGRIMGFLVGGYGIPTEQSVVGMVEGYRNRVFRRLENFGQALQPFSSGMLDLTEVIERVSDVGEQAIQDAIPGMRRIIEFLTEGDNSVAEMIGQVESRLSRRTQKFGEALQPFSSGMLTFTDVIERVNNLDGKMTPAIGLVRQMVNFLVEAGNAVEGVASGGFLGLGASSLEKFGDALDPFGNGIRTFIGIVNEMEGAQSTVNTASSIVNTMVGMLQSAGSAMTGNVNLDNVRDFRRSLEDLGRGIANFFSEVEDQGAFTLNRIADALDRIADIQFGTQFEPFIRFLQYGDQMEEAADQLERITEAITPQPEQTTTLDRIAGAIGGMFGGGGGGRTEIDEAALAQANENGRNPMVDAAVLGMYGILQRWDMNPNEGSSAGGGNQTTNNVMMMGGRQRNPMPASGGSFGNY